MTVHYIKNDAIIWEHCDVNSIGSIERQSFNELNQAGVSFRHSVDIASEKLFVVINDPTESDGEIIYIS